MRLNFSIIIVAVVALDAIVTG